MPAPSLFSSIKSKRSPSASLAAEEHVLVPSKFQASLEDSTTSSIQTSVTESSAGAASLTLRDPLRKNLKQLYQVPVQHLDCSFDTITLRPERVSVQQMVQQQARRNKADVVLVFAIRYPSCPSCREHAQQIVSMAQQDRRLAVVGVVKDSSSECSQASVMNFYQNYFQRTPIFQDKSMGIFSAMGAKKLHPLAAMMRQVQSLKRYKRKGVCQGPASVSENKILGGVLIFDRQGTLRYCQEERVGVAFDVEAMQDAIREVRNTTSNSSSSRRSSTGSTTTTRSSASSTSTSD